jgi:hypothetical protein
LGYFIWTFDWGFVIYVFNCFVFINKFVLSLVLNLVFIISQIYTGGLKFPVLRYWMVAALPTAVCRTA